MEGARFVADAVKRHIPEFVILSDEATGTARAAADKASQTGCDVLEVSRTSFSGICDTEHSQGVAAVFPLPAQDLSNVSCKGLLVILDGVSIPGNMGTVVRSAAAFECSAVIAGRGCCCPFIPKATRASAGTNLLIPVIFDVSLPGFIEREKGNLRFLGAESAGKPLSTLEKIDTPAALVVGSEAHGISSAVEALLDTKIAIPISGNVESLNAAVSASVLIYSLSGKADFKDLQNG